MSSQSNAEVLISLKDISMIREQRLILNSVNLDVRRNDFIAITGPNGGGKTTLLRIMLKLLRPTKGNVIYNTSGNVRNLRIGYLPQKNMIDSHFPITVGEVIESGLLGNGDVVKDNAAVKVNEVLELVELNGLKGRPIGQLSGGQLQRALLARAIISDPDILVFDEPLSYIDKHFETHFYNIMESIKCDRTIVLVSHEMTRIAEMATRHLIVDRSIHECMAHHHYIRSECD